MCRLVSWHVETKDNRIYIWVLQSRACWRFFLFLTLNFCQKSFDDENRRVITVPISYRPFPKSQNSQKWIFQKNREQNSEPWKVIVCNVIEPHTLDITSSNDVLSHLKDLCVVAYSCDTFLDFSKVINKMILPIRYRKCSIKLQTQSVVSVSLWWCFWVTVTKFAKIALKKILFTPIADHYQIQSYI